MPAFCVSRPRRSLKAIETIGGRRVEEGLALFATRYNIGDPSVFTAVAQRLTLVAECEEDPFVPEPKRGVAAYWTARLPEILAGLSRWPAEPLSPDLASEVLGLAVPPSIADTDESSH